jgi:hypothetical protein
VILALVIVGAYLSGVIVSSAFAMRWLANNTGHCQRIVGHRPRDGCGQYHRPGCWVEDGEVALIDVWQGMAIGLAWPILLVPGVSYALATRKPTQRARIITLERERTENQQELERMEREMGLSKG